MSYPADKLHQPITRTPTGAVGSSVPPHYFDHSDYFAKAAIQYVHYLQDVLQYFSGLTTHGFVRIEDNKVADAHQAIINASAGHLLDALHQNKCPITTIYGRATIGKKTLFAGADTVMLHYYHLFTIVDFDENMSNLIAEKDTFEHKNLKDRFALLFSLAFALCRASNRQEVFILHFLTSSGQLREVKITRENYEKEHQQDPFVLLLSHHQYAVQKATTMDALAVAFRDAVQTQVIDNKRPTFMSLFTACATDKQLKGQMAPIIGAMDKVRLAFQEKGTLGDGMLRVSVNLLTPSAKSTGKAAKLRDWDKLDEAGNVGHMIDVNSLSEAEYQQIRKKNGYMSFHRLHLKAMLGFDPAVDDTDKPTSLFGKSKSSPIAYRKGCIDLVNVTESSFDAGSTIYYSSMPALKFTSASGAATRPNPRLNKAYQDILVRMKHYAAATNPYVDHSTLAPLAPTSIHPTVMTPADLARAHAQYHTLHHNDPRQHPIVDHMDMEKKYIAFSHPSQQADYESHLRHNLAINYSYLASHHMFEQLQNPHHTPEQTAQIFSEIERRIGSENAKKWYHTARETADRVMAGNTGHRGYQDGRPVNSHYAQALKIHNDAMLDKVRAAAAQHFKDVDGIMSEAVKIPSQYRYTPEQQAAWHQEVVKLFTALPH